MKEKQCTRLLSFVLVIAMVLSLCPTIAFAGTTLPYQGESAQGQNEQHLMDTGRRICCPGILPPIPMQSSRGPGFRCRIGLRLLLPPRPTPA